MARQAQARALHYAGCARVVELALGGVSVSFLVKIEFFPCNGVSAQNAAWLELSVVLPVYNEAKNIPVLYDRLVGVLEKEHLDFELLFIDDSSNE